MIESRDLAASTGTRASLTLNSQPLSPGIVDSVVRALATTTLGVTVKPSDLRRALFIPRSQPPIEEVIVGDDGTLLLRLAERQGGRVHYFVVGRNSPQIAYFDADVRAVGVLGNKVLGVRTLRSGDRELVEYRIGPL